MEMRPLGDTDLMVSKICLGTMTWGQQNTADEAEAQMALALDHGVTFWDTAEMYSVPVRKETVGATETIIGDWFQKTGRRHEVVLATKVIGRSGNFNYWRPDIDDGESRLSRKAILAACDGSLKRLKTDYIDLYQTHWPDRRVNNFGKVFYDHDAADRTVPLEETLSALQELVKAGKVRHIGVSNETPWGVMEMLRLHETKGLPRIQSIQNPYNLLMRGYDFALSEVSIRARCGLLAYSPLAHGVLSGKYFDDARPEGARLTLFGSAFSRYLKPLARRETHKFVELAQAHGLDPVEMALAFVNDRPFVTSNIIGATSIAQLENCLRSADLTLSDEILAEIDKISLETPIPAQQ